MQTILIYQLCDSQHTDTIQRKLRDLLKANGYEDFVGGVNSKGDKTKSRLPVNTFFKERTSPKEARADLRAAARLLGVNVDCCVCVEAVGWSCISSKKERGFVNSE